MQSQSRHEHRSATVRQVPGSSDPLVDELFATTHRLRLFVDGRLAEKGTTVAQLRALRFLAHAAEPMRMRDLSDMLGVAARTATSVVDALERDGLVVRLPHPTDRRAHLLALTDAGRTCHQEAEDMDREALRTATGALDDEDRAVLRGLLTRIRDTVAAAELNGSRESLAAGPSRTSGG
ncbi:MarR family winged helix-turn-helix transcriptional regulator [Streptomyces sp. MJP52]|uniref:MarR family winged helix-turn-helix transcriptional regulator n=1 Tax=Streptomyces sp. MJP52 TaxID=2940555 RepID=UPI001407CB0D|nr:MULTISPECIES: MarR family winged helix-turn-helix transcriptional regulator [Streptomyces]MDH6227792.1 DNA-binding MarR family transcriptional regulator [Streptomyces sp. MJP52]